MNHRVRIVLQPSPQGLEQLRRLQHTFAQACNELAGTVQQTRCWNRVALHHMAYKDLRQAFPELGSQMACNVIYSVSRACRAVYQGRGSPFSLQALGEHAPLPRVRFEPDAPVYFDRHTLSIRDGRASMFTLDGRMRFDIPLSTEDEGRFRRDRMAEVVLHRRQQSFVLDFVFATEGERAGKRDGDGALPTFISISPDPSAAADHLTDRTNQT
jgi:hypothetical protein